MRVVYQLTLIKLNPYRENIGGGTAVRAFGGDSPAAGLSGDYRTDRTDTTALYEKYNQIATEVGMFIGALQRRCRPQVTRTCTRSALHSRRTKPRRFNRILTSSQYFRLPSTRLAKALDL